MTEEQDPQERQDSTSPGEAAEASNPPAAAKIAGTPTPPILVTHDAIQSPPNHFELSVRMHICSCLDCGIAFALPMQIYLERIDAGQQIHCPNGHVNELKPADEKRTDFLSVSIGLVKELSQAKHDVETANAALARLPHFVVTPMDKAELDRRIRILTHRAEREVYGRPVCRFCGKSSSSNNGIKLHFKRHHVDEISELPAAFFD